MSDFLSVSGTNTSHGLDGILGSQPVGPVEERIEQQALGQGDFFKLLTTQLASQDPLEPMEDTAFIAQMAQFSSLEMMSELNQNFDKFSDQQNFAASHGLIGKDVTMSTLDEVGRNIRGIVESIDRNGDDTRVWIDGSPYNIENMIQISGEPNATTSRQVSNP